MIMLLFSRVFFHTKKFLYAAFFQSKKQEESGCEQKWVWDTGTQCLCFLFIIQSLIDCAFSAFYVVDRAMSFLCFFRVYTRHPPLLFFIIFCFFFQTLIEWDFLAFWKNEKREKDNRKRIFLLFWIKKVAAAVYAWSIQSFTAPP